MTLSTTYRLRASVAIGVDRTEGNQFQVRATGISGDEHIESPEYVSYYGFDYSGPAPPHFLTLTSSLRVLRAKVAQRQRRRSLEHIASAKRMNFASRRASWRLRGGLQSRNATQARIWSKLRSRRSSAKTRIWRGRCSGAAGMFKRSLSDF